jgi:hypothetical protein
VALHAEAVLVLDLTDPAPLAPSCPAGSGELISFTHGRQSTGEATNRENDPADGREDDPAESVIADMDGFKEQLPHLLQHCDERVKAGSNDSGEPILRLTKRISSSLFLMRRRPKLLKETSREQGRFYAE